MKFFSVICSLLFFFSYSQANDSKVVVSGTLQKWHKVTLTIDGPKTDETAKPNPFLDYLQFRQSPGSNLQIFEYWFSPAGYPLGML